MTTYKEALEDMLIRKKMVQAQCESCWTEEAEMAIRALEKQIPLKPYLTKHQIRCSGCKAMLRSVESGNKLPMYCSRCGQRIEQLKEESY
ncbi:MAG: hypothetical protein IJI66_13960 [Erysipelotrichaceae bacterium]|nr:hypothetical protein [Erysipelotrichaceae bacterium]